jgi:outer membrane protein TolC
MITSKNVLFRRQSRWPVRPMLAAATLLALAGCTRVSTEGGFDAIERVAREELRMEVMRADSPAAQEAIERRVAELLAHPLSANDAVQIALLNNRGLQASFQEVGLSEADVIRAGQLPNPHFSMLRVRDDREFKIEQALTINLMSLLVRPQAVEMEQRRFERTQRTLAQAVVMLAADTRRAYVNAVAAEESARYMARVQAAAEAGAELGRRLAQAGNWNRLAQMREQGFYSDAALALARAEQRRVATRERLTRLMGLWGAQAVFQLPERLPDLPGAADDLPDIEQRAIAQRLDLQAARFDAEALAKNLGLTRTTRLINVFEFGPARILDGPRSGPYDRLSGYEVRFELPIFDWGSSKVARAEALYMQAVHRAAETAVNARSEVREAYHNYRASFDIARHYRDEVVPIRKRVSEENLLRHVHWNLRAAGRCTRAVSECQRLYRGAARLLARQGRPGPCHARQACTSFAFGVGRRGR